MLQHLVLNINKNKSALCLAPKINYLALWNIFPLWSESPNTVRITMYFVSLVSSYVRDYLLDLSTFIDSRRFSTLYYTELSKTYSMFAATRTRREWVCCLDPGSPAPRLFQRALCTCEYARACARLLHCPWMRSTFQLQHLLLQREWAVVDRRHRRRFHQRRPLQRYRSGLRSRI